MYLFALLLFLWQSNLAIADVIDPLSNHNLGTASEPPKNQTQNSTEHIGPCHICRYSAKSFVNVSKPISLKFKLGCY